MTEWLFETAYLYSDGDVYHVTLQHVLKDGALVETLVVRTVRMG